MRHFCEFCGRELREGEKCTCGGRPPEASERGPAPVQAAGQRGSRPRRTAPLLCMILLAAAALIGLFVLRNPTVTVDLRDVVEIKYGGYDTRGTAAVALRWSTADLGPLKDDPDWGAFKQHVTYTVTPSEGLSNGDEVTVEVFCDPEILKEYGVKLRNETLTDTVEGLEETTILDFFADVTVSFDGIEPEGTATAINSAEDEFLQTIGYEITPAGGLSNGDQVTVRVLYDGEAARARGIAPESEEKTLTVEGLSTYVRNPGELDADTLAALDQECRDIITARIMAEPADMYGDLFYTSTDSYRYFTRDKNRPVIDAITQEGVYIGCRKQIEEVAEDNNFLSCIYRVDAHDGYEAGTHTFYFYIRFDSILRAGDGTIAVDFSEPHGHTGAERLTADELYRAALAPWVEEYTVMQLEQEAPAETASEASA